MKKSAICLSYFFCLNCFLCLCGCGLKETQSKNATELEGSWQQGACEKQVEFYYKDIFVFHDNALKREYKVFSESSCSSLFELGTFSVNMTFTIGSANATVSGAKNIDFVYQNATATPTLIGATQLNSAKVCGLTTWVANVATDVTGKSCTGFDSANPVGTKAFSIFKIDGNKLYEGDEGTTKPTSDALRPTTLKTVYRTKI